MKVTVELSENTLGETIATVTLDDGSTITLAQPPFAAGLRRAVLAELKRRKRAK